MPAVTVIRLIQTVIITVRRRILTALRLMTTVDPEDLELRAAAVQELRTALPQHYRQQDRLRADIRS